jgi:DNA-directed RNA polymerase alpha subunit
MSDIDDYKRREAVLDEKRKALRAFGPLSTRAVHALLNYGVTTPFDASRLSREEIRGLPNCGGRTLKEIEAWMAASGLRLREVSSVSDDIEKAIALLKANGYKVYKICS